MGENPTIEQPDASWSPVHTLTVPTVALELPATVEDHADPLMTMLGAMSTTDLINYVKDEIAIGERVLADEKAAAEAHKRIKGQRLQVTHEVVCALRELKSRCKASKTWEKTLLECGITPGTWRSWDCRELNELTTGKRTGSRKPKNTQPGVRVSVTAAKAAVDAKREAAKDEPVEPEYLDEEDEFITRWNEQAKEDAKCRRLAWREGGNVERSFQIAYQFDVPDGTEKFKSFKVCQQSEKVGNRWCLEDGWLGMIPEAGTRYFSTKAEALAAVIEAFNRMTDLTLRIKTVPVAKVEEPEPDEQPTTNAITAVEMRSLLDSLHPGESVTLPAKEGYACAKEFAKLMKASGESYTVIHKGDCTRVTRNIVMKPTVAKKNVCDLCDHVPFASPQTLGRHVVAAHSSPNPKASGD